MDLKNRPSENFIDNTGWTDEQRKIHALLGLLNPVTAAANTYAWMKANGYAPIRPEVDFRKREGE